MPAAPLSAYAIAQAGGRHAGLLRTYQTRSSAEIQRALRSYERQVALHRQKVQSPKQFLEEWDQKSPRVQQALLRHWQERAFGPAPTQSRQMQPATRNWPISCVVYYRKGMDRDERRGEI